MLDTPPKVKTSIFASSKRHLDPYIVIEGLDRAGDRLGDAHGGKHEEEREMEHGREGSAYVVEDHARLPQALLSKPVKCLSP